jgi:hypothetical protein
MIRRGQSSPLPPVARRTVEFRVCWARAWPQSGLLRAIRDPIATRTPAVAFHPDSKRPANRLRNSAGAFTFG